MMHLPITKRLISSVIFASFFVFIPAILQITIENTMQLTLDQTDREEFFHYYSVQPASTIFALGEPIELISDVEVYKELDFSWNDILRCDYIDGRGFVNVGSQPEESRNIQPYERREGTWEFSRVLPNREAVCFIEANITADVGYGVEKNQQVFSPVFKVQ